MMVPGMSNVVVLTRGAQGVMAKGSDTKANADFPDRGTVEAEVTVLFSRTNAAPHAWAKAQKAVAEAATDDEKDQDAGDPAEGQEVFGSLVTSVQNKFAQLDEQQEPDNDSAPIALNARASSLPSTPLMGRAKLVDVLQKFKDESPEKAGKSTVVSKQSVDTLPVPDSAPMASSAHEHSVDEASTVSVKEHFPTLQVEADDKPVAMKPMSGSAQTPKISSDNIDSRPPVAPGSLPAIAKAAVQDAVALLRTDKAESEPKKDLGLPKAVLADLSNSHVVSLSHAMIGEQRQLSAAAQIVENIRNAVPAEAIATREGPAVPMPVKVLEVQLQPEGLGPITIALKTEQGKLKVEISTKLEATRHELERNATELVSGLQGVDPSFKAADVNFSDHRQDSSADNMGQASGNSGDRRGTPENMSGFGSNGGRDANQPSANSRPANDGTTRSQQKGIARDLPSRVVRADGIYL